MNQVHESYWFQLLILSWDILACVTGLCTHHSCSGRCTSDPRRHRNSNMKRLGVGPLLANVTKMGAGHSEFQDHQKGYSRE